MNSFFGTADETVFEKLNAFIPDRKLIHKSMIKLVIMQICLNTCVCMTIKCPLGILGLRDRVHTM